MFTRSRKKIAQRRKEAGSGSAPVMQPAADEPDDLAGTLLASFQTLETATLALDGIAHAVGEARLLARIASRPEGASQRRLIALRYEALREDIARRGAEAALDTGEAIAVALGGTAAPKFTPGGMTIALPDCAFASAKEACAIAEAADTALYALEKEAARLREAAGHIADSLARMDAQAPGLESRPPLVSDEFVPVEEQPATVVLRKGRRAA